MIEHLIIPDPCYYHSHETTKVFDLFYEITSAEGYHPFPTLFNLIFTLFIGAILGLILVVKLDKYNDKHRGILR